MKALLLHQSELGHYLVIEVEQTCLLNSQPLHLTERLIHHLDEMITAVRDSIQRSEQRKKSLYEGNLPFVQPPMKGGERHAGRFSRDAPRSATRRVSEAVGAIFGEGVGARRVREAQVH